MKTARIKWVDNLKFEGFAPSGHNILMDGPPESGGNDQAIRPGELTLVALGGCTGIDVISILKKMRQEIDSFEVIVDADSRNEHPKTWSKLHLKYIFKGRNLDESKIRTAIELSQDKYCSVSAMLKKSAELTWECQIISD